MDLACLVLGSWFHPGHLFQEARHLTDAFQFLEQMGPCLHTAPSNIIPGVACDGQKTEVSA